MGKFKDWLEFQAIAPKPGMVGGSQPTGTIKAVGRAANQFVSQKPDFIGNVITAPHPRDQAQLIGKATSDIMGTSLKNEPEVSSDNVNRALAASAGLQPSKIFKLMKKKMKKKMEKE